MCVVIITENNEINSEDQNLFKRKNKRQFAVYKASDRKSVKLYAEIRSLIRVL